VIDEAGLATWRLTSKAVMPQLRSHDMVLKPDTHVIPIM